MVRAPLRTSDLTHYCEICSTLVEQIAERCAECDAPRPREGWTSIHASPYAYLGRIIDGRYFVDRFLGSGASGHVYRARSMRVSRLFAIKVVDTRRYGDSEDVQQEMLRSFEREVDALSRISNPHVVNVYEFIHLSDTILGMVMDYLDGQTLEERLRNNEALTIREAVEITRQIANGLHEAHQQGIVHRDIKPENIMIEALPATGLFARVLDFGVAHVAGSGESTYGFRGTPLYASPEQCTESQLPDHRSDIYSLGCVLFHMLTGQAPFPFANALRVMEAHVEAPRPSALATAPGRNIPRSLDNLLQHMLAREPGERPTDFWKVYQDLSAFLDGLPLPHFGESLLAEAETIVEQFLEEPTQLTEPTLGEFVSLAERTSNELAHEHSLITEADALPKWTERSDVDMAQLISVNLPFATAPMPSITAAAIDRGALGVVLADHLMRTHLLGISGQGFAQSFSVPRLVVALEVDLAHAHLYAADIHGDITRYNPSGGSAQTIAKLAGSVLAMELHPNGSHLLAATERGELIKIDLRTGRSHTLWSFSLPISALHQDTRDDLLLAGLWDGTVACLRPQARELVWQVPVARDAVASVGVTADQRYFATDARGELYLGTLESGKAIGSHTIGQELRAVRTRADGSLIGVTLFGDGAQIWRIQL
ncbi:protein kinase [Lujinxingia vulgaris]|uniref:Protein kinase n=1 Tax=Lujinxingia vulgaris TaxID=2600176 RepID=A0A5C6X857_9DELT|nr:serine/threonine-protein kinase [Lujinxingia vulgaris]TXD32690.1 protein kinase [Lujinxingia vulgaris]